MSRFAVIGIGNPSCGDDAVGPFVASLVGNAFSDPRLVVDSTPCEPSRLLDALEGCDAAVVVDACLGVPSGEVVVLDEAQTVSQVIDLVCGNGRLTTSPDRPSSHGFDLNAVLALGCTLKTLPPKLWVVAVTGSRFDVGAPMSREVRLGAIRAMGRIVCEVSRWLNDSKD